MANQSQFNDRRDNDDHPAPYIPPASKLLSELGLDLSDLSQPRVTVTTDYLKLIISKAIEPDNFNSRDYMERYPDVKGAVIGRIVDSAQAHFLQTGYYEGRLPGTLAFDHKWYWERYPDVAAAYASTDVDALHEHYLNSGYFEGRVGCAADELKAAEWKIK